MTGHKFKSARWLTISVASPLPASIRSHIYCRQKAKRFSIDKNVNEPHERVAKENELRTA